MSNHQPRRGLHSALAIAPYDSTSEDSIGAEEPQNEISALGMIMEHSQRRVVERPRSMDLRREIRSSDPFLSPSYPSSGRVLHEINERRNSRNSTLNISNETIELNFNATPDLRGENAVVSLPQDRNETGDIADSREEQGDEHDLLTLLAGEVESLEEIHQRQRGILIQQNRRAERQSAVVVDPEEEPSLFSMDIHPRVQWMKAVRKVTRKEPEFFRSEEALLRTTSRIKAGKPGYKSFPISPENCVDVDIVYKDSYLTGDLFEGNARVNRSRLMNRNYSESFKQLLSVLGQFVRWAIVRKEIQITNGWKANAVFNALSNELLVQTFIEYFRVRGSASTVNCKTIHLRTVIRSGLNRCGNDMHRRDGLKVVYFYLQKSGNACKKVTRGEGTLKRVARRRAECGKLIMIDDFAGLVTEAKAALNPIICLDEPEATLKNNHNLLKKWFINILALIVLLSGGQRPQVFHQLQCPSGEELDIWSSPSFKDQYIELDSIREKRARTTDLPSLVLPRVIVRYLKFHTAVARQIIVDRCEIDERRSDRPLLINSETGDYLDTDQIRNSFRSFATRYDPELEHITVMSLRASFATMMFRAHREKEIFKDLNEDMFLQELGKMMNTSIEQLKQTYISSDTTDFQETANEVARFLSQVGRNDETNDPNEIDNQLQRFRKEKELRRIFA